MRYFYIAIWVACLAYDAYFAYQGFATRSLGAGALMMGLSFLAGYMIVKNVIQLVKEERS